MSGEIQGLLALLFMCIISTALWLPFTSEKCTSSIEMILGLLIYSVMCFVPSSFSLIPLLGGLYNADLISRSTAESIQYNSSEAILKSTSMGLFLAAAFMILMFFMSRQFAISLRELA